MKLLITTVKEIGNIDKKRATGYNDIPPKVAAHELAFLITSLIVLSVEASYFLSNLKKSELPLF